MNYVLTPEAEAELAEAVAFHALQVSPNVARHFLAVFEQKARLLTEFPGIATPTTMGRHLLPLGRYPYSLLYRVQDGAIAHHACRPGYWQKRSP